MVVYVVILGVWCHLLDGSTAFLRRFAYWWSAVHLRDTVHGSVATQNVCVRGLADHSIPIAAVALSGGGVVMGGSSASSFISEMSMY